MADFLGGIAQRTRRRVAYVAETTVPAPRKAKRQAEAAVDEAVVEPKFEPVVCAAPVPPAPSAQSVAESVLMDHPAPKPVRARPRRKFPRRICSQATARRRLPTRRADLFQATCRVRAVTLGSGRLLP